MLGAGSMFATKISPTSLDSIFIVESVLECVSRLDGKSILLVDRRGQLLASSRCAEAIFKEGNSLKLERGYLAISNSLHDAALKRILGVTGSSVETVVLQAGKRHMLLRASAFNEALVCLTLTNAEDAGKPVLPNLESLFGLTPCEARIINALYQGRTPQWIADDHQNSIHTIRAHIRHCYDKLGVSCREELWSKLNALRVQ